MRGWRWTFVIIAAGLLVQFAGFYGRPESTNADSARYLELARSLLRDGTFRAHDITAFAVPPRIFPEGPPVPETMRTPGYPLLLAAVLRGGGSPRSLVLLQHLLLVALAALLHRRGFGGFFGPLLVAISPDAAITANLVATESPASVVVALSLMLLIAATRGGSRSEAAGAGLLLGLAMLIRPIALYLPFPLAIVLVARRPTRALALPFLLAALLLPGFWVARNARVSGVATFSSIDGESLLLYRADGAIVVAGKPPLDAIFALQKQFGFFRQALRIRVPLVREALAGHAVTNHAQRSQLYKRLAVRKLAAHPFAYAAIATSGAIALLVDDLPLIATRFLGDLTAARIAFVPVSLGLLLLAGIGCRALLRREPGAGLLLTTALLYFIIVSAGPEAEPRFVAMFLPLYAAAIGYGLESLLAR
jgi:4-amino-4-deoxy-L-arabinose transferase-like glycosyltransferase